MAETKYGKYIISEPLQDTGHHTGYSILAHEGELKADCSICYHCISEPTFMPTPTHSHDCPQLLCFIGGNPTDIRDFEVEIELCLG